MSEIPDDLRYAKTHEWARREDDGTITLGITDHAQEMLGDLVYVELPEPGRTLSAEEEVAVVESVKAASDIYSPLAGEVTEVNEALSESPELINNDPYGDGWMIRVKPDDESDWEALLDADAYREIAESEEQ